MGDLILVHVVDAAQGLMRPRLDVLVREANFGSIEDACQVKLHILKDHELILWNSSLFTMFCVAGVRNNESEVYEKRITNELSHRFYADRM